MEEELLWQTYPRLFHMAAADSWPSVQQHGLLSTVALLDLFEITRAARTAIECEHRPQSVKVAHPMHGEAVIRDQKPMSDGALRKCLRGMSPSDWYRLLNRRVFFWLSETRLTRLLGARAYRNQDHCVLTLDTSSLVQAHGNSITLSAINSGSTIFNPQPRGLETFKPIPEYPFEEWRRRRNRENAIVELAVDYSVPSIVRHALVVEIRRGPRVIQTLWRS